MALAAKCGDTGTECAYVIRGDDERDLLMHAAKHGRSAHQIGTEYDDALKMGRDFIGTGGGATNYAKRMDQDTWLKKVSAAIKPA